jgi:hypothetical protein
MESALYYTFSTIAQTLAAAIAVLGAFALYRLQSMNAELSERSSTLAKAPAGARGHGVREMHVHGRYEEVLESIEDFDPGATAEFNYQVTAARERLSTLLRQRRSMRRYLNIAFWVSAGLLTSSLIMIATAPKIATMPHAPAIALTVGIVWFVVCIGTYAKLIWSSLT